MSTATAIKTGKSKVFTVQSGEVDPFLPKTEQQLEQRIDEALEQLKQGLYQDAEDVEREIITEFGLV